MSWQWFISTKAHFVVLYIFFAIYMDIYIDFVIDLAICIAFLVMWLYHDVFICLDPSGQ